MQFQLIRISYDHFFSMFIYELLIYLIKLYIYLQFFSIFIFLTRCLIEHQIIKIFWQFNSRYYSNLITFISLKN